MILTVFLLMMIFILSMLVLINSNMFLICLKFSNLNIFFDLEILVNVWNLMFLLLVILISTSVMIFSYAYMSSYFVTNFLLLYLLFIFSMMWLILSNNFYWMMLGWDGLGVVSFLLIVYYMNYESISNGLFTLFQNRLGDLFFVFYLLGMFSLLMTTKIVVYMGLIFLIAGSAVKSAQFPFNSWLLAAMSAPTPISSLVHSSTLVVAGVYILLQFSYCLFEYLNILTMISVLTLLFSTFGLLNESDMKKLIAYSTMSHVGLMMYFMSFGMYKIVYFHLNIHAMFKSLMFMSFGFLMLVSYHSQDKRLVTMFSLNPLMKIMYYFSCMCLAGLPFLIGFFSKDLMIEKIMANSVQFIYVLMLLLFLSVSVYYSLKLMVLMKLNYVLNIIEKSFLSSLSLMLMVVVMMIMVNVNLSLVFSLSLEFSTYKMVVYLWMLGFFFLSLMTNMNYKIIVYDKFLNFQEIWKFSVFFLDAYVYWNINEMMKIINNFNSLKLILLMNWWVLVVSLVVF